MLAYQDQHRSTCVASKLGGKIHIYSFDGKTEYFLCSGCSSVGVIDIGWSVVCIIILNYANLSPICLREIAAQWADISGPG